MSRLRFAIASLLLSSAVGCAGASAGTGVTPGKPVIVQPAKPAIDRAALRAKLAERRALTMSHFLAYRENRVYPLNTLPGGGMRHVWQDDNGNLCAAATLISTSPGPGSGRATVSIISPAPILRSTAAFIVLLKIDPFYFWSV